MSSFNSRISLVAAASTLVLGACATTAPAQEGPVDLASSDQKIAAERADPLTRARFWAGEYEKEPENIETAKFFAKALRDIESHDRVAQVASDTLILYPADYDMLMLLGRSYLSLSKPELASQVFGRAIQVDGSRAEGFAALGLAYDKAGQHQFAQRAYKRALNIDPDRTSTLTNYGLSQALSGNIDGAETALRNAADNSDADMRVRQNLALVLGLQGKFDEMTTVDSDAPQAVMQKNAEVLQRMIEQVSPVATRPAASKVSSVSPAIAQPAPKEMRATDPAPHQIVEAAPTEPVVSADLPDVRISSGIPKKIAPVQKAELTLQPKTLTSKEAKSGKEPTKETPQPKPVADPVTEDDGAKASFLRGSLE